MAAVSDQPTIDLREPGGWRRSKNQIATGLMYLAFVIILIPLGLVIYEVIAKGAKAISWQVLTNSTVPPNVMPLGQGGMGAAVVGTLEITAFAAVIAVPLGILGAVYIGEYGGKNWLGKLGSGMAEVIVAVPPIVMGLFIFTVWVIPHGLTGLSGFAGSLALACLMLPLVIRSTYEMLRLVPDHLREASYALGATKARVTLTVVLPSALSGLVGGSLLAIARAAGETAPLLFTIGAVESTNSNLFSGATTALPAQIFTNALSPHVGAEQRAWGAALTLIVIAFILLFVARIVTARFTRYAR